MTVTQVKDMLCRKYENAATVDVLLAGQDRLGLHMYDLQPNGKASRIQHGAKGGAKAEEIQSYLSLYRKDPMNLGEAEQLVRESLKVGPDDFLDMCFIYKAELTEGEEEAAEMPPEMETPLDPERQSISGRSLQSNW